MLISRNASDRSSPAARHSRSGMSLIPAGGRSALSYQVRMHAFPDPQEQESLEPPLISWHHLQRPTFAGWSHYHGHAPFQRGSLHTHLRASLQRVASHLVSLLSSMYIKLVVIVCPSAYCPGSLFRISWSRNAGLFCHVSVSRLSLMFQE